MLVTPKGRKYFFFEKKKQKTFTLFCNSERAPGKSGGLRKGLPLARQRLALSG
jgi:hypothetical protein